MLAGLRRDPACQQGPPPRKTRTSAPFLYGSTASVWDVIQFGADLFVSKLWLMGMRGLGPVGASARGIWGINRQSPKVRCEDSRIFMRQAKECAPLTKMVERCITRTSSSMRGPISCSLTRLVRPAALPCPRSCARVTRLASASSPSLSCTRKESQRAELTSRQGHHPGRGTTQASARACGCVCRCAGVPARVCMSVRLRSTQPGVGGRHAHFVC